jgi:hypothetical protein
MNSTRIAELANLASELTDKITNACADETGAWVHTWNDIYDQEFAKLIIRECLGRIQLQSVHDEVTESWVYSNLTDDIKEIFGVE